MKRITPQDVRKLQHSDDALLLDVRTPAEVRQSALEACTCVPHGKVGGCPDLDQLPRDREIILICASGQRATMAAEALEGKGFTNLSIMEGGVNQWKTDGLPVKEGKGVMSLERQVRIAAGALVAIGAALAWFVNPAWVILPGFVGCGLVFAGITDTCAMGMLMAKMPWNK
ncbi:rhodanese-like domain-containing protein [Verrucomicrobiaceae bacterium 227]